MQERFIRESVKMKMKENETRQINNELVNEQGLRSVLDVTGRKKYIMALRQTCLFFFLNFFVAKFISSLVLKLDNLWCSLLEIDVM